MRKALIGHTGFVGSNLAAQMRFDASYNSANIESIEGESFDLIACAGAPGAKWLANQQPKKDAEGLSRLMHSLARARADHIVLISTVDVYPAPREVDEETPIDPAAASAYGRHRLELEDFIRERFESTVVRLPGLFGPGLKKNVIFDFLNDNRLEAIAPKSAFQFYPTRHLWRDVARTRELALPLVNFATEPLSVGRIALDAFGFQFDNPDPPPPASYDVQTMHASAYGQSGSYLYDAAAILSELRDYIRSARDGHP